MQETIDSLDYNHFLKLLEDKNINGMTNILDTYSPIKSDNSKKYIKEIINLIVYHCNLEYVYKIKDKFVYASRVPPTHFVGCSSAGGLEWAEMEGHVGDYLQFVSCFVALESVEMMLKECLKNQANTCPKYVASRW